MGGEVEITEHKKCVSLSVQSFHKLNSCSERATVVYFETQSASRGGRKKWALLNFVGAVVTNVIFDDAYMKKHYTSWLLHEVGPSPWLYILARCNKIHFSCRFIDNVDVSLNIGDEDRK